MRYQPRRSAARWLEGAPKPVLACYDSGPNKNADRYTVLYGAPLWESDTAEIKRRYPKRDPYMIPARAMNSAPFHPLGICLCTEVPAWNRKAFGKKIRFSDLPSDCQAVVEKDCKSED